MERAVYAQGWYARQHNYHPSRPPRRLRMIEDFADYRATMLTWPALGGGGISLPYLEHEADGEIPARFRMYGYVTDREFSAACSARGIKSFSVIFCMQGWEFPVELDEAESEVLALNETRGAGRPGWLGLREFTQDRYPRLWKSFRSYFPDGLRNSDGEEVTDLWEEACSRDVHGEALRADWLECPDREHVCHFMDTNNPVWREYLKAVIRIHVDAGVDGIQFDEPDGANGTMKYGGCFCKDCMKGFAGHLRALPPHRRPAELADADDLDGFHYGRWLLDHGRSKVNDAPRDGLADAYADYLRASNARNFQELARYARGYAAQQGRELLISANLYDGAPWHDPLVAEVDVLVPEQRHTLTRQPGWMRYIVGFASGKPVSINFNPYGGVLPELVEALADGRALDRYRTMLYEAAALGANMSVPYGAWMGSVIEDAMYAPHNATKVIQDFLADNEAAFSTTSVNEIAVVYAMDSNLHAVVYDAAQQSVIDPVTGRRGESMPEPADFFHAADVLALRDQPFDVVVFHDGDLRVDDASAAQLGRYRQVVCPGCTALSDQQVEALAGYLEQGGSVTVVGALRAASGADVAGLLDHPGTHVVDDAHRVEPDSPQVVLVGAGSTGVNLTRTGEGTTAVHLVNYDYDSAEDRTVRHEEVQVSVRLPHAVTTATVIAPGREPCTSEVTSDGGVHRFCVRDLDQYAITLLE